MFEKFEKIDKYFPNGIKVFDPYIEKDIVDNQYHNFDEFLNDIDMVVILVALAATFFFFVDQIIGWLVKLILG